MNKLKQISLWPERTKQLFRYWVHEIPPPAACTDFTLASGCSLFALFYLEAMRALGDPSLGVMAYAQLKQGAKLLDERHASTSLFGGITGYALALHEYNKSFPSPEANKLLAEIDESILASLADKKGDGNFEIDLINGVSGILNYARIRSAETPTKLLEWLLEWTDSYLEGGSWLTHKSIDLGLAHGLPGLLLSRILANLNRGYSNRIKSTIRQVLDWLWQSVAICNNDLYFRYRTNDSTRARLAWCYGGLGLGCLYMHAAKFDSNYAKRLSEITEHNIVEYNRETANIVDASVCHGHAGAALLFSLFSTSEYLSKNLQIACRLRYTEAANEVLKAEEILAATVHDESRHHTYTNHELCLLDGHLGKVLALQESICRNTSIWHLSLLVS